MKVKHVDKHYLYQRDGHLCYYCGKSMVYGKVSLDHYLPRSAGGTDDVFNLVISCKACNGQKKNAVPLDVEKKHLEWFIQGVLDGKILVASHLKISHSEVVTLCQSVYRSYSSGAYTLFQSYTERFYVSDNTIVQIAHVHTEMPL